MKQREIKFRAWDKVNNKWLSFDEGDPIQQDYDGLINNGYWSMFFDYEPTEVVLMQYTGLTDKNGVDIYEGDILQLTDSNSYFKVVWVGGGFTCISKERGCMYNIPKEIAEVIGNIYQNPELI